MRKVGSLHGCVGCTAKCMRRFAARCVRRRFDARMAKAHSYSAGEFFTEMRNERASAPIPRRSIVIAESAREGGTDGRVESVAEQPCLR